MEHRPPVILITSSEDEGGAVEKRPGDAGCWRSVDEEYKILADLTGFDNLRAMLETERAHMRSRKRKRKTRKKKKKRVGYGAQEEVPAVDAREEELADEVFAPESNVVSNNIDASPNIIVDVEREKEQVDGVEAVETTEAFKGNGVVKSSTVIDLCSSSTEEEQVDVNIRCCRAAKELVPADTVVPERRKRKRIRRRKIGKKNEVQKAVSLLIPLLKSHLKIGSVSRKRKNKSGGAVISFRTDPVGTVSREKKDKSGGEMMSFRTDPVGSVSRENKDKSGGTVMPFRKHPVGSVLRKLLRGPRYFDPPSSITGECLRCGEVHVTKKCAAAYRKKPCCLCAGYGHSRKKCPQNLDCVTCKGRGHRANRCPEENRGDQPCSEICLRCGESGHDMLSCRTNYSPDDLKEIQCYVCKNFGHLCCVDFKDLSPPGCVCCYNCGQSGHLGSDCTKSRGNTRVATCSKGKEEECHSASRVATCSKGKEEEDHSASIITTCSTGKEEDHSASCSKGKEEDYSASRVATCSKGKEEGHSAGKWANSLLNTNAFTVAHIASECSTAITPTLPPEQRLDDSSTLARETEICKANVCSTSITSGDTLQPKQRLGDSSTLAQETEICKGSNSMPKNIEEAQRKNQSDEQDQFASRVATCSKRKAECHSAGKWIDSLLNKNAFALAHTAINPADTLQPKQRLGDLSNHARETGICKGSNSNSMPGNLDKAQRKNQCEEENHFASRVATCFKRKKVDHFAPRVAACSKCKVESHIAVTWVNYLHNTNAFTLKASVCSPPITPACTLLPEQKLGDSLTLARETEICKASICSSSTVISPANALPPKKKLGDLLTLVRDTEICKGSNSMPKNLDEAERKNQCEEEEQSASTGKEECHFAGRWVDYLHNTNAFALAGSPAITPAYTLLPAQRLSDPSTLARETEICKGSNSMPENLEGAQRKKGETIIIID